MIRQKNEIINLIKQNPNDIRIYQELAKIDTKNKWIFSIGETKLEALGLDGNIYSNEKCEFEVSLGKCHNIGEVSSFPCDDRVLAEFLIASESKDDILKPYEENNNRKLPAYKEYKIKDATVICSPLSIAVLDCKGRVIRDCSHNAPEILKVWNDINKYNQSIYVHKGILASVQQTFNLGHWFIDSLARLEAYKKYGSNNTQDQIELIIDTNEHKIIRDSLTKGYNFKKLHQSLPFSVYKVNELIVPLVSSFEERVRLANKFMRIAYSNTKLWKGSRKIYLSRQGLKRRKINNHREIEDILDHYGYEIIRPEEQGLENMFTIMNGISKVIGPNGAAMCNTVLGKPKGLQVGIIYPESHIDDYYYRVSQALQNKFVGINSENVEYRSLNDSIRKYYYPDVGENYNVNPERLIRMLEAIENS